jgi:hypothetical protein
MQKAYQSPVVPGTVAFPATSEGYSYACFGGTGRPTAVFKSKNYLCATKLCFPLKGNLLNSGLSTENRPVWTTVPLK